MSQKIALITGANRGIGFETARQLGELGIKVLVGARSEDKGNEAVAELKAAGADAEYINVDVDDAATHTAAAKEIEEKDGRLDILINNAGVFLDEEFDADGAPVPASRTSQETLRKTFDTNFFNTVAITQAMLPLVKKAGEGRIVFLSSLLGSLGEHSRPGSPIFDYKVPAYNISKTALNAYVVHLAYELRDTNIKVNAAHPGSVVTDMNKNGQIPVEEGAKTSVALATLPGDSYSGRFIHLGEELPW